ncbi:PREDICTED: PC-esterase domain-containing protein 1B-like [Propithecus coquereli]|uniref:PC-esterase domain-containing protein 1B-like n=1 Tax=Propithecus coquereli TaxID=379532 RepID=UPI00063EE22D|nr:PREDICTED: PC-esterase domain-containing protein 1B-like [Propithecus coquereli]
MAHLRACEVRQLLHNKFVVIMGDSIQRAVYKDLVLLLQRDCLLSSRQLKAKGELSFERDVLLEGGRWGRMHNGTDYREVRQFCDGHHLVRFYFLTRAYSQYVEAVLEELQSGEHTPDVVVMNSCLWDVSKYGQDFRRSYCRGLQSLFGRLAQVLPQSCLLVWNTAMPVAETVSGGFLPPEPWSSRARLRQDVLEANFYSSVEAGRHGVDVLDLHFHFRHAGQHRQRDGVHWDEWAHRHLSMLLLAHVADAWGVDLPCREPMGGWNRDGPAGRRPDPAGRRQPEDRRGEPASSWRSPCPHSGPMFTPHRQDTYLPSDRSLQGQQFSSDTLARQIRNTNEANWMVGRESRLSPIRTDSAQHQGRGSAPYPPPRPGRPRRRERRHTNRRM